MYKRTLDALAASPPSPEMRKHGAIMADCQFGKVKYSSISFTWSARTNQDDAVVLIEFYDEDN